MKIACTADTHGLRPKIPEADVFIHAGDLQGDGSIDELMMTFEWIRAAPATHKIVVPGNHDFRIEPDETYWHKCFDEITYLVDDSITIKDIKFYGSPWQRTFPNWAFYKKDPRWNWKKIPQNTDVLITHVPPFGRGDKAGLTHLGDKDLITKVLEIDPTIHIFGHIHEGYGSYLYDEVKTIFINCCHCDALYKGKNDVVVFDLPTEDLF